MSKPKCTYIFKRGKNANTQCTRYLKYTDTGYCKKHHDTTNTKNKLDMSQNIQTEQVIEIQNNYSNMTMDDVLGQYETLSIGGINNRREEINEKYEKYRYLCDQKEIIPDYHLNLEELDTVINEMTAEALEDIHGAGGMKYSEEFVKTSLFNINLILFNGAEQMSKLQDKYTDLDGLTNDIFEAEEEYKRVLYEIYREHYEEIDEYLSPLTTYALLVVKTTSMRYMKNKKKTSTEE